MKLLGSKPNLSTKFVTEIRFEMNDDAHGTHLANSQLKSKTSMLKSILCDLVMVLTYE